MNVRWAGCDDVDELVRLRRVMFTADGQAVGPADEAVMAAALTAGLADGSFFAAVVDGASPGRLAASGIGMVATRVPGPANPSGRFGYIQSMVTDEPHRRRGLARAVLLALLDRFEADGVRHVDLHATETGAVLYRAVGFGPPRHPELRWVADAPRR